MITYSSSFVDFLRDSNCKVARLLYYAHCEVQPSYRLFVTNKQIDYITFRNDGTISYLPAGKEHKQNDSGEWSRDGRQSGKPGKVIQKLFTPNALKILHVKEFECFTNEYKAEYNGENFQFSLRGNKSVPSVYEMQRAIGGGSLNDSCMNGDSEWMDIYKSCNKLSILTLVNGDDQLCGRALVWKASDTLTLMDRIYVVKDFMYDMFLNYARENEWYHKQSYKSYENKTNFVSPDGESKVLEITITTPTDFDSYPYIDTFSYGDHGSLNNYNKGDHEYTNTDGTRGGDDDEDEDNREGESYDDFNGEWINDDDAIYIEHGERRYCNRTAHIDNCIQTYDGDWYHENDDSIVEVNGRWYAKDSDKIRAVNDEWHDADDVVYSDFHGEDLLLEDCVRSEPMGDYILKDEAVEVDDEWYHKDHEDLVEIDGEIYHKDNLPEPAISETTNELVIV